MMMGTDRLLYIHEEGRVCHQLSDICVVLPSGRIFRDVECQDASKARNE